MSSSIAIDSHMSEDTRAWYRHGWLWFLISFPLVSVALGCIMLYLAFSANNSLVVDDYYKEGKAYNLRIERDRLASLLGLGASMVQNDEGLVLDLARQESTSYPPSLQALASVAHVQFAMPQNLLVRWVHVTQEQRDGSTEMTYIGQGRYVAPDVMLPLQGKFRLHISPVITDAGSISLPAAGQNVSDQTAAEDELTNQNSLKNLAIDSDWRLTSWLMTFEPLVTIDVVAPEFDEVFTRSMLE